MIKIYGAVDSKTTPYSVWQTPMGACFNSCLTDSVCVFAGYLESNNFCSLYSYNPGNVSLKIVEVEAENGKYAAFKTNLPDSTCPANYKNVDFIYTSEAGDTYPWQFSPNTNSWTFSGNKS
ncbi:unnamed protein product [Caenorhabditis brenneri]